MVPVFLLLLWLHTHILLLCLFGDNCAGAYLPNRHWSFEWFFWRLIGCTLASQLPRIVVSILLRYNYFSFHTRFANIVQFISYIVRCVCVCWTSVLSHFGQSSPHTHLPHTQTHKRGHTALLMLLTSISRSIIFTTITAIKCLNCQRTNNDKTTKWFMWIIDDVYIQGEGELLPNRKIKFTKIMFIHLFI